MKKNRIIIHQMFLIFVIIPFCLIWIQACNYNYYRGAKLEDQGRFEEANIEYHRAYTQSPSNNRYKEAYLRTARRTAKDLLERYNKYIKEKKYDQAFRRLVQAQTLTPGDMIIKNELRKWYRILLAGKVELVQIKSLRNQMPLSDQIFLEIRINSPNVTKVLSSPIDYQTQTFSVEDILYDPPQNLLMLYSINSIGVTLINNTTGQKRFKKFIDFRTPVLVKVHGVLQDNGDDLESVLDFYPAEKLRASSSKAYWYPDRGIRYSLELSESDIKVNSSVSQIDFLPQVLYINKQDKRYFLDFGHLQLFQNKLGGSWSFKRKIGDKRAYLIDLKKNLLLNAYFYYREGGYPFVVGSSDVGS